VTPEGELQDIIMLTRRSSARFEDRLLCSMKELDFHMLELTYLGTWAIQGPHDAVSLKESDRIAEAVWMSVFQPEDNITTGNLRRKRQGRRVLPTFLALALTWWLKG
jgi:hypothetical protein